MSGRQAVDLFVIGGGINGCGIARDAAGRGVSVTLAEMGDLGSATSSASTKLFHGGLRYLEYYEFRLVREALREREVLLAACPHISRPMRFVLPHLKGTRPAWLVRAGLFLYDHMGGHHTLPRTRRIDLVRDPAGVALKPGVRRAFEYSDGWVDDARLVVLNARDAAARGATILTRARVTKARVRDDGLWHVTVRTAGGEEVHRARALVNASGPWVAQVIEGVLRRQPREHIRLVRGSHIVVPKLFDHDRSYFLQGHDKRIIFAIPYEDDFTLIGTTDKDHEGPPETARCTEEERNYLCALASEYFVKAVRPEDVVWSFSGVRPLYDDGATSATAATRDYVLSLETQGAPLLNVFGGKITTYRRLAEAALAKLAHVLPMAGAPWTAGTPLPGGDFPIDGFAHQLALLRARYPFLTQPWARRLLRSYGTEVPAILGTAQSTAELGRAFGATLTEAELRWLFSREYARTAEDVVWRRSKLGLRMTAEEIAAVGRWLEEEARATHSGAGSGNDIEPRDRL